MTADLAGWLLVCIAEDEEAARSAEHVRFRGADGAYTSLASVDSVDTYVRWVSSDQRGHHIEGTALMQRFDPARVLAECAAKRALIAGVAGDPFDAMGAESAYELLVLGCLAVVYADRPGFREEWRP